jgi:hypothetical protein
MKLNLSVLDRLMSWGAALDDFRPVDAVNALTIVQGYVEGARDGEGRFVEGIGDGDEEKLYLFALDLTWMFWLDELFDSQDVNDPLIEIDPILHALSGGAPTTPAAAGCHLLRQAFDSSRDCTDEYGLWIETALAIPKAWRVEQQLSKRTIELSYEQYLDNGFNSSGVPHIVATASLLYGFDLAARMKVEPDTESLFRNLSLFCRLQNDVSSVEKERREGTLANAVFVAERSMPADRSVAFVEEELRRHEHMLKRDIERVSRRVPRDPFCQMARVMGEANKVLYANPHGGYASQH